MDIYAVLTVIGAMLTIIGTGAAIVTLNYRFMRNFKLDMNKNFEKHERRFELIEQRLFMLCMGKSLPDILKAEREDRK